MFAVCCLLLFWNKKRMVYWEWCLGLVVVAVVVAVVCVFVFVRKKDGSHNLPLVGSRIIWTRSDGTVSEDRAEAVISLSKYFSGTSVDITFLQGLQAVISISRQESQESDGTAHRTVRVCHKHDNRIRYWKRDHKKGSMSLALYRKSCHPNNMYKNIRQTSTQGIEFYDFGPALKLNWLAPFFRYPNDLLNAHIVFHFDISIS
jgi:hypothetical protein